MFKRLLWNIKSKYFSKPGPKRYLMSENPDLARFEIGGMSYGKPKVLFSDSGAVLRVGKCVSIADDATILLGGEHRSELATTYPLNLYYQEGLSIKAHPITKGDVTIGNDVWIGREALILSGVTIGDGAVIGARALVAKDVAPYSIVAGNPARHIRFRFSEGMIIELIKIAWWNWPDETIREAIPYLLSDDIRSLIDFAKSRTDTPAADAPRQQAS